MSLKEMVVLWQAGVENAEAGRFEEAVDNFTEIPEPSARIFFNIASAFLRQGNLEDAERNLDLCVKRDPHMALGYFQRGCLCLQKQRFVDALKDFELALTHLRGNLLIDYKQLGLQYKLYSCEVLYNKAYAELQLGRRQQCDELLENGRETASGVSESRHRIITSAIESLKTGKTFLPYRLPKSCMWFLPPRNKTDVIKPVKFLKPAKVVSSIVDQDDFTGFVGAQNKRSRSPSPNRLSPPRSRSRAPKPSFPPPPASAGLKIEAREASLQQQNKAQPFILPRRESSSLLQVSQSFSTPTKSRVPIAPKNRPPKPQTPPPPTMMNGGGPRSLPRRNSPPYMNGRKAPTRDAKSSGMAPRANQISPSASPARSPTPTSPETTITIKVHYTSTRAVRVLYSIQFNQLSKIICSKFGAQDGTLTLWLVPFTVTQDKLTITVGNLHLSCTG
ncbi:Neutrophil cytosol factor 2 [Geodia barretti]|uniref:Neutrophil cytosol factor 2 n=1 Tax=Geodia barretti TaxID=519541 RepID=A0AA35S5C0_GEOBA|nr:Neutrophil cytosol factor 2 [Geodia barretti]